MNNLELEKELTRTLESIDVQIQALIERAKAMGIRAYRMQDTHGNFVLSPLLCARANVLVAIHQISNRVN